MSEVQVKINAKVIDSNARDQIKLMSESPAFKGLISIMPDVHMGVGAVIGVTGKFNKCVIPNVIGVDIGCGVTCYPIGKVDIDFAKLDDHIRHFIPLGFNSHLGQQYLRNLEPHYKAECIELCDEIVNNFYSYYNGKYTDPILQLGTLGGGNHFIEVDVDSEGNKYITVHSGSRNLGQKIATYFQTKAKEFHLKLPENRPTKDLEYLPLDFGGAEYLHNMKLAQEYAQKNREIMIQLILKFFNIRFDKSNIIESVHNFISFKDDVVRKGAISAHKGERVIIPLNMRDGIVLGVGKGNSSYNNSAPHGAGRIFGRNQMKEQLRNGTVTMDKFKEEMKDVYSTSVNNDTIDESPFAYKSLDDIKEYLEETVEIEKILKPIYNLKAAGD